jgi:hypothetical protein
MEETTATSEPAKDPGIRRLEEVAEWVRTQDLGMIDPATIFVARVEPES